MFWKHSKGLSSCISQMLLVTYTSLSLRPILAGQTKLISRSTGTWFCQVINNLKMSLLVVNAVFVYFILFFICVRQRPSDICHLCDMAAQEGRRNLITLPHNYHQVGLQCYCGVSPRSNICSGCSMYSSFCYVETELCKDVFIFIQKLSVNMIPTKTANDLQNLKGQESVPLNPQSVNPGACVSRVWPRGVTRFNSSFVFLFFSFSLSLFVFLFLPIDFIGQDSSG